MEEYMHNMKLEPISDITIIKTGITTSATAVPVLSFIGVALADWVLIITALWFIMLIIEKGYGWYKAYKDNKESK